MFGSGGETLPTKRYKLERLGKNSRAATLKTAQRTMSFLDNVTFEPDSPMQVNLLQGLLVLQQHVSRDFPILSMLCSHGSMVSMVSATTFMSLLNQGKAVHLRRLPMRSGIRLSQRADLSSELAPRENYNLIVKKYLKINH